MDHQQTQLQDQCNHGNRHPDLGLDPLKERRKNARLTLMYKIVHGLVAVSVDDIGLEWADTRTRASHQFKLKQQRSKTDEYRHSFAIATVNEWNNLPACMAEAGTLDNFKCQLTSAAK